MKTLHLKTIISSIVLLLLIYQLHGQSTKFIGPLEQSRISQLDIAAQEQLQKLTRNAKSYVVSPVQLQNGELLLQSNELTLELNETTTLTARLTNLNYESESKYSWYGHTNDGEVLIIHSNGRTYGTIRHKDDVYDLQYLSNNFAALLHYNKKMLQYGQCAAPDSPDQQLAFPDEERGGNAQAIVRVLVLFTPAAENTGRNINDVVDASMGQFLTASINSSIQASLQLAGVVRFNFNESNDIWGDVQNLRNNIFAQQLRNNFEADLVVLLTDGPYGNYYGVVSAIGPDEDDAYTIVEIDQATASMTFAHEVGHLFGCRHENDPTPGDAHGYGFKTGSIFKKKRGTIMHTLESGRTQVLHFSNPYRTYDGVATGQLNVAFNSRVINVNSRIVCDFRFTAPDMSTNIYGPGSANDGDRLNFTSSVSNGTSPYSYRWQVDIGGGYYTAGTSSSLTYTMPTDKDLRLRLAVTDANGNTATDDHFVRNLFEDGGPCEICPSIGEEDPEVTENSFLLFPNPAEEVVNITYQLVNESNVSLSLIDISGKIIEQVNYQELKGTHELELDLSDIDRGVYIINFKANNFSKAIRLVKE